MEHLEDTIERLSGIVAGICDDVLTLPEVTGQPDLMVRLQGFMTEALGLAESLVESNDAQELIAGSDVEEHINRDGPRTEVQNVTSRQQQWPNRPSTPSTVDSGNTHSQTSAHTGYYTSTEDVSYTSVPNLPFGLQLSAQNTLVSIQGLSKADTKPFPVQLVEATLSRACWALSDPSLPPARLKRAFGFMIGQYCTREELLRRVQWLLGPGYSEIYGTAGANWRPPPIGGLNNLGLGSSVFPVTDDHTPMEEKAKPLYQRTQGEELLTALEVASQLENLGASFVGSNTIELCLAQDKNGEKYSTMRHSPMMRSDANPPGVRLRLNALLLTTNLSSVAKCVGFGPAYPRDQITKAVEASVVFAWNC